MAQRGVLGKISRWFSGPSDTYFFGLQVAMKCFGEDTLRARFARVIEESRLADESVQEKRRFLRRFVALLEESALFWSYGFWDYIDDQETAAQEFNTWVNEIESGMATEEEELGEAVDDLRRTSNQQRLCGRHAAVFARRALCSSPAGRHRRRDVLERDICGPGTGAHQP